MMVYQLDVLVGILLQWTSMDLKYYQWIENTLSSAP